MGTLGAGNERKKPKAIAVPGAKRDAQLQEYKPLEPITLSQRLYAAELKSKLSKGRANTKGEASSAASQLMRTMCLKDRYPLYALILNIPALDPFPII